MRGPREVFEDMSRGWLRHADPDADLLADDVVIEIPFAAPGRPRRIEGLAALLDLAARERADLPVRLEEVRNVVVHDTADPEVIVVEYEIAGSVVATGARASAAFIGVLRVRDGKAVLWREYQDTLTMAAHLG